MERIFLLVPHEECNRLAHLTLTLQKTEEMIRQHELFRIIKALFSSFHELKFFDGSPRLIEIEDLENILGKSKEWRLSHKRFSEENMIPCDLIDLVVREDGFHWRFRTKGGVLLYSSPLPIRAVRVINRKLKTISKKEEPMKSVELFWKDFTKEAQQRILTAAGISSENEHNWDVFPVTTLDFEEEEMS